MHPYLAQRSPKNTTTTCSATHKGAVSPPCQGRKLGAGLVWPQGSGGDGLVMVGWRPAGSTRNFGQFAEQRAS